MSCHIVPIITGAQSLVGYEDDCCISYTVTIVDVRCCTRCIRVPEGQQPPREQQGMCCSYQQCRLLYTIQPITPRTYMHSMCVCIFIHVYSWM